MLVYNDAETGRHRLAVAMSLDGGLTWPSRNYLERFEPGKGSASYPTAIQSLDGRVHVSYSFVPGGGAAIKHATFAPDWIAGQ